MHAGVYLVGHRAIRRGTREMAAVLACGPGAVISHANAAALWKLLPYPAKATTVSVTVAGGDRRSRPGIEVHRVAELSPEEVEVLNGIPVTGPLRTIVDVAATIRPARLERVVAQALREGLVTEAELRGRVDQLAGRRGVPALRRVLGLEGGPKFTRSPAERRMLALVREAGLPVPEVNAELAGYEVDFLWRAERLAVEVDGRRYHSDPLAFQRDRDRSNDLQLRGYTVLRVTWRDLVDRPDVVANRIRRALSAAVGI
ncbi:MAG: DUF559 domain-containing protein [Solirubrobacterales bacterium]